MLLFRFIPRCMKSLPSCHFSFFYTDRVSVNSLAKGFNQINYMRELNKYIAIFAMLLVSASAFAQIDTLETVYGRKYNDNFNLRYTQAKKAHTELSFGGHCSGGDISSYGADLQFSRVYTLSNLFAWRWGALASAEYADNYGSLADVMGLFGVRFGKSVYIGVDALAGAGQMSFYDESYKNNDVHRYFNSQWRAKIGAQATLGVKISKNLALEVLARYLYAFNNENDRTYNEAEGWTKLPTDYHNDKYSVGANLSWKINSEYQVSGDNCWMAGAYSGYSFTGNKGVIAGAEMYHFKRTGAKGGRVLGFGTEQVFGDESTNMLYGKAGYQILPKGADSPIAIELSVKGGLGEYVKSEEGSSEKGFSMNSNIQTLAVAGKFCAGLNVNCGRVTFKVAGEFGGHAGFETDFVGDTYTGSSSNLCGFDGAVTLGAAISL